MILSRTFSWTDKNKSQSPQKLLLKHILLHAQVGMDIYPSPIDPNSIFIPFEAGNQEFFRVLDGNQDIYISVSPPNSRSPIPNLILNKNNTPSVQFLCSLIKIHILFNQVK